MWLLSQRDEIVKDKDAILEAHVQFELRRFSGEKLKETLQEEISSLFAWCEHVKVNDVVRSAQLTGWIQRYVIEMPISDELMDFIKENVVVVYEFLQDDQTRVDEILPRKLFDRVIEAAIGLEDLRRSITHQVVSSSVYTMLISDVLYHGIKSFVLTENGFAKNIPGASSFVRLGQNALSAAAPKMEKNVDKQLTAFINAHMQETTAESESFLNKVLDDKSIRKLGDEIWDANAKDTMSKLTGYVDKDSLPVMVEIVQSFWLHFRKTQLFSRPGRGSPAQLFPEIRKKRYPFVFG